MVSSRQNYTNSSLDHLALKVLLVSKSMSEVIVPKLKYDAQKPKSSSQTTLEKLDKFNHSSLRDSTTPKQRTQSRFGSEAFKIDHCAQQLKLSTLNLNFSRAYPSEWQLPELSTWS